MSKYQNNIKKSINKKYHKYIPNISHVKKVATFRYNFAKFMYEMSPQVKTIILLSLTLLLVLLFYFLIYKQPFINRHKTFLNRYNKGVLEPYDFSTQFKITHKGLKKKVYDNIPNKMLHLSALNPSFVISFWVIINEWNYNKWTHLLSFAKSNDTSDANNEFSNKYRQFPGFWLSPDTNRLNISFDSNSKSFTRELLTIEDIPLRKWINIACVVDNYAIGIYINGKLTKSHVIEGVPLKIEETGNIYINKTHQLKPNTIQMTYLQVYSKYLNPEKIYQLYNDFLPKIESYSDHIYDKSNVKEIKPFVESSSDTISDMEYIEDNDVFEYEPITNI